MNYKALKCNSMQLPQVMLGRLRGGFPDTGCFNESKFKSHLMLIVVNYNYNYIISEKTQIFCIDFFLNNYFIIDYILLNKNKICSILC